MDNANIMKDNTNIMIKKDSANTPSAKIMIKDPTRKQGYLGNLATKTQQQLEELLLRQDKLLNDKNFISKLPDKGSKIKDRRSEILEVLNKMRGGKDMESKKIDVDPTRWNRRSPLKEKSDAVQECNDEMEDNLLHSKTVNSSDMSHGKTAQENEEILSCANKKKSAKTLSWADEKKTAETPSCETECVIQGNSADLIAKELMGLDINGKSNIEQDKLDNYSKSHDDDISCLSSKFSDNFMLQYEDRCKKSSNKSVFKPSKPVDQQVLNGFFDPHKDNSNQSSNKLGLSAISKNSETDHPDFGMKSGPILAGTLKANIKSNHKSSLWSESSATGRSFGKDAPRVKVISIRDSLKLQKDAHDRQEELLLQQTLGKKKSKNAVTTILEDNEASDNPKQLETMKTKPQQAEEISSSSSKEKINESITKTILKYSQTSTIPKPQKPRVCQTGERTSTPSPDEEKAENLTNNILENSKTNSGCQKTEESFSSENSDEEKAEDLTKPILEDSEVSTNLEHLEEQKTRSKQAKEGSSTNEKENIEILPKTISEDSEVSTNLEHLGEQKTSSKQTKESSSTNTENIENLTKSISEDSEVSTNLEPLEERKTRSKQAKETSSTSEKENIENLTKTISEDSEVSTNLEHLGERKTRSKQTKEISSTDDKENIENLSMIDSEASTNSRQLRARKTRPQQTTANLSSTEFEEEKTESLTETILEDAEAPNNRRQLRPRKTNPQ